MRVLGINGSPNKNGNTYGLIKALMGKVEELSGGDIQTDILHIGDYIENPNPFYCNGCSNPCEGQCIREHRIQEAFKMLECSDILVVGSPLYFGTISVPLKVFLIRADT